MTLEPRQPPAQGRYWLPNLFTTAALATGFLALVASIDAHFDTAAACILIAMVLDGLDGRIARLTHTESAFGAQYDSLSDMVAFGVAPALLAYVWALHGAAPFGLGLCCLYSIAVAIRLARFNTSPTPDPRYFTGLPSPAAAWMIASLIWTLEEGGLRASASMVIAAALLMVAALMVSTVPYRSFKKQGRSLIWPVLIIVAIATAIASAWLSVCQGLLLLAIVYLLSGPFESWLPRKPQAA